DINGTHARNGFYSMIGIGPLQFKKKIRSQDARRLLLVGEFDVTTVALDVWYESLSQFHREYKRLFGLSPLQDIRGIRAGEIR
ncbi:MAG: AraC family transcriptional regulator, partial [Proteobacteria bacterium]